MVTILHDSDCAVHNMPAMPSGPCDCGAQGVKIPWGVHRISDIYQPGVHTGLSDGRWVIAVPEPYTGNKIVAAWWVLTGRAYALQWPKAGDLESALNVEPRERQKPTGTQARNAHTE